MRRHSDSYCVHYEARTASPSLPQLNQALQGQCASTGMHAKCVVQIVERSFGGQVLLVSRERIQWDARTHMHIQIYSYNRIVQLPERGEGRAPKRRSSTRGQWRRRRTRPSSWASRWRAGAAEWPGSPAPHCARRTRRPPAAAQVSFHMGLALAFGVSGPPKGHASV